MKSKFKKNINARKNDPNAWMLSLADLMSLLLCFFVMLFSMNSVLPEKWNSYKNEIAKFIKSTSKFILTDSAEDRSFIKLNRKKFSNSSYDFGYIKNLFMTLSENLNLQQDIYFIKSDADELTIHISKNFLFENVFYDENKFILSKKGKNLVFEMSQILGSLSNSFWIGGGNKNSTHALQEASFVAEKFEELGIKFNIPRKVFLTNDDFHFDNDYIIVIIKSYEANI